MAGFTYRELHTRRPSDETSSTDITTISREGTTYAYKTKLENVASHLTNTSSFLVTLTSSPYLPVASLFVVPFDNIVYDNGNEFNPLTYNFEPKEAGLYLITTTIEYLIDFNGRITPSKYSADLETALFFAQDPTNYRSKVYDKFLLSTDVITTNHSLNLVSLVYFKATGYSSVWLHQRIGATNVSLNPSIGTNLKTYFSGVRIR